MFCRACGVSIPIPGVHCPRCNIELARSRGATVVMEDTAAPTPFAGAVAPVVPPLPMNATLTDERYAGQRYEGASQPSGQGISGWTPPAPESARGLTWRAIVGTTSLLLGFPLILAAFLMIASTLARLSDSGAILLAAGSILAVGALEFAAGARVLKGSASPHIVYILGVVMLLLSVLGLFGLMLSLGGSHSPGEWVLIALLFLFPLVLPVVRLVLMFLPSTGAAIGSRDMDGEMRTVPFALWCPILTLLTAPVHIIASFGVLVVVLSTTRSGGPLSVILGGAGVLVLVVLLLLFSVSSVGLLKRKRWSIVLGAVNGGLWSLPLLSLLAYGTYDMIREPQNNVVVFWTGVILTAVLLPAAVWLIGAIRFGFKLPPYLRTEAATREPRAKLMELLLMDPDA